MGSPLYSLKTPGPIWIIGLLSRPSLGPITRDRRRSQSSKTSRTYRILWDVVADPDGSAGFAGSGKKLGARKKKGREFVEMARTLLSQFVLLSNDSPRLHAPMWVTLEVPAHFVVFFFRLLMSPPGPVLSSVVSAEGATGERVGSRSLDYRCGEAPVSAVCVALRYLKPTPTAQRLHRVLGSKKRSRSCVYDWIRRCFMDHIQSNLWIRHHDPDTLFNAKMRSFCTLFSFFALQEEGGLWRPANWISSPRKLSGCH